MKVFLDNNVFSIQKAGGVSMYWYEMLRRFLSSDLDVTYLNRNLDSDNIYEALLSLPKKSLANEKFIPKAILRYLPLTLKLPSYSIFHAGYLRVSLQKNVVNIVTIHDFAHDLGLSTSFPINLFNIKQKALGINKADGIICISENTKKDLLHFYPHISEEKIKVIYHGVNNSFRPLKSINDLNSINLPDGKLILFIGERKAYKNFNLAVETIEILGNDYKLLIVGGGELTQNETKLLNNRIKNRYFKLANVSIEDLNYIYNRVECLLYPSSYEGFGFPPAEAMRAGCPVIVSNCSSLPEIVGRGGILVNELEASSFGAAISKLDDDTFKNHLIQQGTIQSQRFSFDNCFLETTNFYQFCLNQKLRL